MIITNRIKKKASSCPKSALSRLWRINERRDRSESIPSFFQDRRKKFLFTILVIVQYGNYSCYSY